MRRKAAAVRIAPTALLDSWRLAPFPLPSLLPGGPFEFPLPPVSSVDPPALVPLLVSFVGVGTEVVSVLAGVVLVLMGVILVSTGMCVVVLEPAAAEV